MKKIIYSLGICLLATQAHAQFVNSTEFYVSEGAVVSFNTNVVNEGKFINNGKLHFQKNVDNLSTFNSNGSATFDGNGSQTIKSQSELTFNELLLDNDVKLETAVRVNSVAFRRGVIEASAASPLIFTADAKHSGASDFSHVKGFVQKEGNTAFEFPLGDGTNFRSFNVGRSDEKQVLTATYLYKNPLNVSSEVAENVEALNENEFWSLKSASTRGSAQVSVKSGQSSLEDLAFLNKGTWDMLEGTKLSSSTNLANGTLFTLAKSRGIKAEIGVYPNPTEGEFFLKLGGMNENEAVVVDITNQDGTTIMHKEGLVKDLRRTYQLPSYLPSTELAVRVMRENNKSLVQKMILKK